MLCLRAGGTKPTTLLWNRMSCVSLQEGISSGPGHGLLNKAVTNKQIFRIRAVHQTEHCFRPVFALPCSIVQMNCGVEMKIGKSADMVSFQLFNFWWNNKKNLFIFCSLQLLVITVTSCPLSKLPRLINRWHWFAALPPTSLLGLIVRFEKKQTTDTLFPLTVVRHVQSFLYIVCWSWSFQA